MTKPSKKQVILDVATKLFATKGFTNTSMTELAGLANIAGATVFYHYKTKEDLFIAVLENVKTGILNEFAIYFMENHYPNGLETLLGAIAFHLHLSETKNEWFLLLSRHFTHELAAVHPSCRTYLQDIYSCLVDIYERALLAGQQDGSIRGLSARKTALITFATVDGIRQMDNNNLYDASVLYGELLTSYRYMIENKNEEVGAV